MKKLKLDLDLLKVDTFETTVSRQRRVSGTVLGQTVEETCMETGVTRGGCGGCVDPFPTGATCPDETCDVGICHATEIELCTTYLPECEPTGAVPETCVHEGGDCEPTDYPNAPGCP